MPPSHQGAAAPFALVLSLFAAGCATAFDADRDDHVVGSQTTDLGVTVDGKGPVHVLMRQGQVGTHSGGVWRAWRVQTQAGEALTPWLTRTPLCDGENRPCVIVTTAGHVFAFDPGAPIDSRDEQPHGPRGWYHVGAGGLSAEAFDQVAPLADGGYETATLRADGAALLRVHARTGALLGELAIVAGSARGCGERWRIVTPAGGGDAVVVDPTLATQGRLTTVAQAPGEWIDLADTSSGMGFPIGLSTERALASPGTAQLPGPWQWIKAALAPAGLLLLGEAEGGVALAQWTQTGWRVVRQGGSFALVQTRPLPPTFADLGWPQDLPVVLMGERTTEGTGYMLFACFGSTVLGPFPATTSDAATAAMWQGLTPYAEARRAELLAAEAARAKKAAEEAAAAQRAIDAMLARIAVIEQHELAYFEALKAGDLAAAGRTIATIESQLADVHVLQGHSATERLRQDRRQAEAYLLDWELRRPDRNLDRLAPRAQRFFDESGPLYERFCREATRLMSLRHEPLSRADYDALYRHSAGFDDHGREWLRWHYELMEKAEAHTRYNGLIAEGRFRDAHDMAYKLGFDGWVTHLLTQAKGRIAEGELESLLRIAVERAPTPQMRQKLEAARQSQWLDMIAAEQREQRERFARIDQEQRAAAAAAAMAEQQHWQTFRDEAAKRGFIWR